jgi:hypothetical protein
MNAGKLIARLQAPPGRKISLADYPPNYHDKLAKPQAGDLLARRVERLARQQDLLYAQNRYAVLVIIQGLDASGKDGTIKHVMSGLNPFRRCLSPALPPEAEEEAMVVTGINRVRVIVGIGRRVSVVIGVRVRVAVIVIVVVPVPVAISWSAVIVVTASPITITIPHVNDVWCRRVIRRHNGQRPVSRNGH